MGHIFISYSHKDSEYVHKLADTLQKEGFEVWIDDRIHYGSEWPKVVTRNLDSSDGVIVVLSNNSYESDMVQNEVTRAREKHKPIFPLLFEGENWLIVQAKQFVDVRNGSLPTEKFYKRLEEVTTRRNLEKELKEKAERELAEKIAQEKAEREAIENAARKNTEHKIAEKPQPLETSKSSEIKNLPRKLNTSIFVVIGVMIIVVVFIVFIPQEFKPAPIPTATATTFLTQVPVSTFTSLPPIFTPTEAETPTAIVSPTPELGIGSTLTSPNDGMKLLYVPAGNFLMGFADSDLNAGASEKPEHTVYLDAFWIDRTDVTNAMYAKCVGSGACNQPANLTSHTRSSYYGNSEFDNYPVIYVTWYMADTYCKWAGRQLPTEAQWEKAARGTDGRMYPWGNNAPNDSLLHFNNIAGDTTKVGSYPNGVSPYGALDMAGNVSQCPL